MESQEIPRITLYIIGPDQEENPEWQYILVNQDGYLMTEGEYVDINDAKESLIDNNPDITWFFAEYLQGGYDVRIATKEDQAALLEKNKNFWDADYEREYIIKHKLERKPFD